MAKVLWADPLAARGKISDVIPAMFDSLMMAF
jgi:hypothetical protein